jgi:hypothetical protein
VEHGGKWREGWGGERDGVRERGRCGEERGENKKEPGASGREGSRAVKMKGFNAELVLGAGLVCA